MCSKCCLKVNGEGSELKQNKREGESRKRPLVVLWVPPCELTHW